MQNMVSKPLDCETAESGTSLVDLFHIGRETQPIRKPKGFAEPSSVWPLMWLVVWTILQVKTVVASPSQHVSAGECDRKNKASLLATCWQSQMDADSQSQFAEKSARANGAAREHAEPVRLHEDKAEQGDSDSQYHLGVAYREGLGVPRNDSVAAQWFRKAAKQEHPLAQLRLGLLYFRGEGVRKSHEKAASLFRKAAMQGVAEAQFNLGNCYAKGRGLPQSYEQARFWHTKAAMQSYGRSQAVLGLMHASGLGGKQDFSEAYKWLALAAEGEDKDAGVGLAVLLPKMTDAQINEGRKRIESWKRGNF
jgi:uncharacterized protein